MTTVGGQTTTTTTKIENEEEVLYNKLIYAAWNICDKFTKPLHNYNIK